MPVAHLRHAATAQRSRPLLVSAALMMLAGVILLAITGDLIAPYDYTRTNLINPLRPPAFLPGGSPAHALGTDHLGRDVLSRVLYSIRITLLIACIGAGISAVIGTLLGIVAGQVRGLVEDAVMMAVDIQASLPFLVFALTALAVLGNSFAVLVLVIGLNGWEGYARLARGSVLAVMARDYVLAAQSLGIRRLGLYRRYLLPNILSTLLIQFSISLAGTILLESGLSFLGLGIQHPMTSLGQMLSEGRDYLLFAPWLSFIPGLLIFLIILAVSLVGDWLRDVLDPTL